MTFKKFKKAVEDEFKKINKLDSGLFYLAIDKEAIWDVYLNGFEDEVDKKEHNCNCCRRFLQNFGGTCSIDGNSIVNLWEGIINTVPDMYKPSTQALADYCRDLKISHDFYTKDDSECGIRSNYDEKNELTRSHFSFKAKSKHVKQGSKITEFIGKSKEESAMMNRLFEETTIDAVDKVLKLIEENKINRGQQFKSNVEDLKSTLDLYNGENNKELFCWKYKDGSISRFRNSAIGTLVSALSQGKSERQAVAAYQSITHAGVYQQTVKKASVSSLQKAKEELEESGLMDHIMRTHVCIDEIPADKSIYTHIETQERKDPFAEAAKEVSVDASKINSKVRKTISINEFIKDIVPNCTQIDLLFEKRHRGNFASILKPESDNVSGSAGKKFLSWDNEYSWSYTGGMADSVKEKVKRKGGIVEGAAVFMLSWNNYDDLDLHVKDPEGVHYYYRSYVRQSGAHKQTGGFLDIDMNAGGNRKSRDPVENIVFPDRSKMREGEYTCIVKNYSKRENSDQGFDVEISVDGKNLGYSFPKNPNHQQHQEICRFSWTKKGGLVMPKNAQEINAIKIKKWGLNSGQFIRVNKFFLSPNHWGSKATGNKHYIFSLDGCKSDENLTPFFNEQLSSDLKNLRRAIQDVSEKVMVEPTEGPEVSGLGFSESINNDIIVKCNNKDLYRVTI